MNFNFLFDTFVPVSSIITISIVVGYTLPRHDYFGLFWLLCWTIAVIISLAGAKGEGGEGEGLFNTGGNDTNNDRVWGIIILIGIPLLMLLILYVWWKIQEEDEQESSSSLLVRRNRNRKQPRSNSTRLFPVTIRPIRNFVLKYVPLWSMVAIHIYRLDGLSVVIPFWYNGRVPKFIGYQTIILDVFIGVTAIPFTYILYSPSTQLRFKSKRSIMIQRPSYYGPCIKDIFWLWNSIGLYDLCSGYIFLIMNILNIGGQTYITEPSLLPQLGKHPFPLLLLFQVPLAISIHVLLLTNLDEIIEVQSLGMMNNNNNNNNGQLVLPR
jgi:TM2 domain-containing membrane protein YozV